MLIKNKINLNNINLINIVIALIPLSIILGNSIININVILIDLLGLYAYKSNLFYIKKSSIRYLLYSFFFYLIFITFLNNWHSLNENELYKEHLIKSFFYLRFLILFLVVNKLIEEQSFNIKFFFISCAFFSLIVSIDITIQYFFKKNIVGFPIVNNKPSSFFQGENIAGGYLQHFIIFFNFYVASKFSTKKKINFLILILFLIFLFPIFFSGNRMSALIYLIFIPSFFLLEKNFKQIFISFIFIIISLFFLSKIIANNRLSFDLKVFTSDSLSILQQAPKLFVNNELDENFSWNTGYLIHFNTGIQIWKQKKIFGHGLKSFRLNCTYDNNQTCNTHPHNYFIEIMVDLGIIGIFLIYSILIIGLINFFKYYFSEKNLNSRLTASTFFLLIFFELFPIRSTGSFFSTSNSVIIFLMLAIFLNLKKLKKL